MNYTAQGIKTYLTKNTPLQQKGRQCITIDEENLFHFLNPLFIPKLTGTISNSKQLRATFMQHHFRQSQSLYSFFTLCFPSIKSRQEKNALKKWDEKYKNWQNTPASKYLLLLLTHYNGSSPALPCFHISFCQAN